MTHDFETNSHLASFWREMALEVGNKVMHRIADNRAAVASYQFETGHTNDYTDPNTYDGSVFEKEKKDNNSNQLPPHIRRKREETKSPFSS